MKKILLTLTLFSIIFIISCGDDDGGKVDADVNGSVQIGDVSVSIANGVFGEFTDDGVYGASFIMSDGPIDYDEETFEGDYLISVTIASVGDSFESGTYPLELTGTKGALVITSNSTGQGSLGTAGSVEISGAENTFTITFDVDLEDESKLTGTVSGAFERVEIDIEE